MGVKGVTIESMRGRGEVEVQAEGGTDRGGRGCQEKGNEGVSKIVPANTDSLSQSAANITSGQTWLQRNWRRKQGASEENNKPSAANLGHIIFLIYIQKSLGNL